MGYSEVIRGPAREPEVATRRQRRAGKLQAITALPAIGNARSRQSVRIAESSLWD
jgi:hypothetical protein